MTSKTKVNKIGVNNEVILMKKKVKQAKVHILGKLTRKLKELKGSSKTEGDDSSSKNEQKIQKLCKEIGYLKQIDFLKLSREALCSTIDAEKTVISEKSTPEERAQARIFAHKALVENVKTIKEKFGLEDEDNEWRDTILQVGKKKQRKVGKAERIQKRKDRRKEIRELKLMDKNRSEWMASKKEEDKDSIEATDEDNEPTDEETEEDRSGEEKDEHGVLNSDDSESVRCEENSSMSNFSRIEQGKKNKQSNISKADRPKKTIKRQSSEELNSMVPERKSEAMRQGNDERGAKRLSKKATNAKDVSALPPSEKKRKPSPKEIESDEEDAFDNEKTEVDSFFVTKSGDSYISSAVTDRVKTEQIEEGLDRKKRRDLQFGRKTRETVRQGRRSFEKPDRRPSKTFNQSWGQSSLSNNFKRSVEQPVEADLHPSWVAKQKLNASISAFAGKRTTFGEESVEENLHPSWAAKQRMRPAIASFAGKKTAFKNDAADDNLHPSWAAKQKMKPSISAFAGKKTTFGED